MTTIHLEPKMVPASARQGYSGTKFRAYVTDSIVIPSNAGLWDGGSRDLYSAVELETGRQVGFPGQSEAPWGARQERRVTMRPGIVVLMHSIFQGRDLGLTIYMHPDNATRMLPAPVELSEHEAIVLDATRSLKSSYNGMDRYEMKRRDHGYSNAYSGERKPFMSRAEWDAAKQNLIARGLLNKAGAITVAGRNAAR